MAWNSRHQTVVLEAAAAAGAAAAAAAGDWAPAATAQGVFQHEPVQAAQGLLQRFQHSSYRMAPVLQTRQEALACFHRRSRTFSRQTAFAVLAVALPEKAAVAAAEVPRSVTVHLVCHL